MPECAEPAIPKAIFSRPNWRCARERRNRISYRLRQDCCSHMPKTPVVQALLGVSYMSSLGNPIGAIGRCCNSYV